MMETADQDVKFRLLQAAKKLFAAKGFDGTSIRQICEEAGANVALVSYHFGGKDKIFRTIFETYYPNHAIREWLSVEHGPVEGIRMLVREVTLFRLREPDLIRLLQIEITLNTPRIDVIREFAFPLWRGLRDLLEEGRRQGLFRYRSLDTALLSTLGAILQHNKTGYFSPLLTEPEPTVEERIADLADYILGAVSYVQK